MSSGAENTENMLNSCFSESEKNIFCQRVSMPHQSLCMKKTVNLLTSKAFEGSPKKR